MTAPLPAAPKPRNSYVDTWRGLAILGVVCVHFGGSFANGSHAWNPVFYTGLALNQVFSFAVPLFVFLAGLLAGWSRRQTSLARYYGGRAKRIVVPYLFASVVAFFAMNHYQAWQRLSPEDSPVEWILVRVLWFGIEPTFYFIPLILQLYLLQPLLKALPTAAARLPGGKFSAPQVTVALLFAFLALHLYLGIQCYRGALNYYVWGRPFSAFWLFYFFAGLHFQTITATLSRAFWRRCLIGATVIAALSIALSYARLIDPAVVGEAFNRSDVDLAYARPIILLYDLAAVTAVAAGVALGFQSSARLLPRFGQASLSIYLWHIMLLYWGAWRFPDVMRSCREVPELLVLFPLAACLIISTAAGGGTRLIGLVFRRNAPTP